MEKVYVVYWSGTGNTEAMANMLADGVKAAGAVAEVAEMDGMDASVLAQQSAFALGSPAMGDEELEDTIVEPFVAELEKCVSGKKIVLFGSYDWGDGEWMRSWAERMKNAGAEILGGEGIIANNEPDDEAKEKLEEAGRKLAEL